MAAIETTTSWRQQYLDAMSNGLERLLNTQNFSDTTIMAGTYTVRCHKAILAAISPYFEAMFTSGMRESVTGVVKIEGIDSAVFKDILSFIYSGIDIIKDNNAEEVCQTCVIISNINTCLITIELCFLA